MSEKGTWEELDDLNNQIDFFYNDNSPCLNQEGGIDDVYKLVRETESLFAKWNYKRRILKYEITNNQYQSFYQAEAGVHDFINTVFDKYINKCTNSHKIRMVIQHRLFQTPLSTPFIDKSDFAPGIMSHLFYDAIQSKKAQGNFLFLIVCV
jgi:hypothetical protein